MRIGLAPKEQRWKRGVYAASTHDCQQAMDCSNALLLAALKRRERRAPLNAYEHAKRRARFASFILCRSAARRSALVARTQLFLR
jgi:hypothetical protein